MSKQPALASSLPRKVTNTITVRRYLILRIHRKGGLGFMGKNSISIPGAFRNSSSRRLACTAWPPTMSSEGAISKILVRRTVTLDPLILLDWTNHQPLGGHAGTATSTRLLGNSVSAPNQ